VPERLTTAQLADAAGRSGVDIAALRAILTVETGDQGGFLPDGRVRILFERHILWKRLQGRGIFPHELAKQRPDLCGPDWERKYYLGRAAEWGRVEAVIAWAQKHDPARWESYKKAAYESCSWGLFQLMGFHYAGLGYANVYAFKHAQEQSEAQQLQDALRWMDREGLLSLLRARRWPAFVRRYNGPGQVAFYAARLTAAYLKAKVFA
jgi:hypothetical protein